MANRPPDQATRDQNLDDLLVKVKEWGQLEQQRLDNETQFLRTVLQGRGAPKNGTSNLAATSAILQTSIDEYVTFGV